MKNRKKIIELLLALNKKNYTLLMNKELSQQGGHDIERLIGRILNLI